MIKLDNKLKSATNRMDNIFCEWELPEILDCMGLYLSLRADLDGHIEEVEEAKVFADTQEIEVTADPIKVSNISAKSVTKKEDKRLRRAEYDEYQEKRRQSYQEKLRKEREERELAAKKDQNTHPSNKEQQARDTAQASIDASG